jgi:arylsulfatase A-like enzyme
MKRDTRRLQRRSPCPIQVMAAVWLLSWPVISTAVATDPVRPNVLLIMADDLRPQLGCYGDPVVRTPRLDAFAEGALRFDLAFAQSAVCSPSRNSLLGGLRPNTTGLRGFGVRLRDRVPDIVTLPQHFKNNGYHTRAFGKIFHLYDESMLGSEDDPDSWSAALQLPAVPVWGPKQNALRERLIAAARARGEVFRHPHDWPRAETWDDSDVPDDAMQDGDTSARVEAFLASRRGVDQPFFLAVGFLRPHLPFNAPRRYWDRYDPNSLRLPRFRRLPRHAPPWAVTTGIVRNYHNMPPFASIDNTFLRRYLQGYLACISYVDACVGRVLDALAAAGHADTTLVVFLGDHGYQMGEYDSWGHKHSNFEISTRAPLLVAAPGMSAAGKSTRSLTEFLDIYPTLCELAGLSPPAHLEGRSFARLLSDPAVRHREAAYSEMRRGRRLGRSIRTDAFRYTEWRDARSSLVARELYDHRRDERPGALETENLAQQEGFSSVMDDLSRRLRRDLPHAPVPERTSGSP